MLTSPRKASRLAFFLFGVLALLLQPLAKPVSAVTATTTTLLFTSAQVSYGTTASVTARLNTVGATGAITFMLDGVAIATQTVAPSDAASTSFRATDLGWHTLSAQYSGDATYAPSTSATTAFEVVKVTSPAVGIYPTTVPPPMVPFVVNVEISRGLQTSDTQVVQFSVDSVRLPDVVFGPNESRKPITVPGQVEGTHVLSATFGGNNYYTGGTTTFSMTLTKLEGLQWPGDFSCPPPPVSGPFAMGPHCLPSTDIGKPFAVSAQPGLLEWYGKSPAPSGLVKFYEGANFLGTAPLLNGTATLNVTPTTPGVHNITFTYDGDLTYKPSPYSGLKMFWANEIAQPTSTPQAPVVSSDYKIVSSRGGVWNSSSSSASSCLQNPQLNARIIGATSGPVGYWMVASDGGIFSCDGASFFGSTGAMKLNKPVVSMAATPSGNGYWMVASDGGIFSFGDAQFFGSMGGSPLNKPIVGMSTTPTGKGYWLVASDGGIFAFGDANFFGSMGAAKLNQPIVAMTATASGNGYWFVAADGGMFSFGDAQFYGSTGDIRLGAPVVSMLTSAGSHGYTLLSADGKVYAFGDAQHKGNAANSGTLTTAPYVAVIR